MDLINIVILGLIQGLTEFLPVSSSGHLVIIQSFFPDFSQPGILFDVFLHFGTLFAILVYFRKTILTLSVKYLAFLGIGTVPAVFAGLFFRTQVVALFQDVRIVGWALIITAIFNLLSDKTPAKNRKLSIKNSFLIGIAQAFAIIPGISRSGLTIFAAVKQGIDRKKAAEFSFLLSMPAVLGANILEIISSEAQGDKSLKNYFFGFFLAFVSGLLALHLVISFLQKRNFKYFSLYCLIVGLLILSF